MKNGNGRNKGKRKIKSGESEKRSASGDRYGKNNNKIMA